MDTVQLMAGLPAEFLQQLIVLGAMDTCCYHPWAPCSKEPGMHGMDVTSTCWNFKCIDLHFHRVVWRLCRLWTLAVEVMRDCSLAGSWQLQTQNLSQGLPHPQSFNSSENNNCSRFILVVFEWYYSWNFTETTFSCIGSRTYAKWGCSYKISI